jgi:hypothetical protein
VAKPEAATCPRPPLAAPSWPPRRPPRHPSRAASSLEEHKAAVKAEDQKINEAMRELAIGEGHRVSGMGHRDLRTGGMTVSSYHYDDTESRFRHVGIVRQNSDGTFTAHRVLYTAKGNEKKDKPVLGTQFPSRKDAHISIMAHHELAKHQDADRKTASAGKAREAAAEAAKARAQRAEAFRNVPGPNGTSWELHEMPNDGTTLGAKAAAKAKLSLKAGWATVVIETDLDDEKAKAFLHNVTNAMEKARPNLGGGGGSPVKFYVPSDWQKFKGGSTGAYVYYGDSTVYVNPRMASGDQHASFQHSAHAGHFMPAGKSGSIGEYTLIHELGHVVDGQNRHSRPMNGLPTDRKGFTADSRRDHRAALQLGHSQYGRRTRPRATPRRSPSGPSRARAPTRSPTTTPSASAGPSRRPSTWPTARPCWPTRPPSRRAWPTARRTLPSSLGRPWRARPPAGASTAPRWSPTAPAGACLSPRSTPRAASAAWRPSVALSPPGAPSPTAPAAACRPPSSTRRVAPRPRPRRPRPWPSCAASATAPAGWVTAPRWSPAAGASTSPAGRSPPAARSSTPTSPRPSTRAVCRCARPSVSRRPVRPGRGGDAVLIVDENWAEVDDATVWHAAQGGAVGAREELRRREAKARTAGLSPDAVAAMASRIRNGVQ